MNKKLITALLVLSMPLTVFAAPTPDQDSGWHHKEHKLEHLTKVLGLNAEQKANVETILNDEQGKFKALHEETRTRLQGALTKEQYTKLEELHKQHQQKHPGGINEANPKP
jgi:Spy/CpxP family protein refolding chaperone